MSSWSWPSRLFVKEFIWNNFLCVIWNLSNLADSNPWLSCHSIWSSVILIYTPLQKKCNTWFRSSHDPNLGSGQQSHRGKKLLKGGVSSISSHRSRLDLWLKATETTPANNPLTRGVADPKLGSWEHLNQVLRFFWRGVYIFQNEENL